MKWHTIGSRLALLVVFGCGGAEATSPTPATPAPSAAGPVEGKPTAAPSVATESAPAAPPVVGDALEVGPTQYKKVFENDSIRVLEVTFKPGDKVGLHRHPDHAAYVISSGKMRMSTNGSPPQDMDLKQGQAVFLPAMEHTMENVGSTDMKAVIVELKATTFAPAPAGGDPAKVGPTIYKSILDNDRVRVFEVTFKKGAKIAAHVHPDHVAYVLSGGKLRVTSGKAAPQDFDLQPRQAVYLPAQSHTAENKGTTEIKVVVFELRGPAKS